MKMLTICENCLHRDVCGKYKATGGVNKCQHHAEERKGVWEKEWYHPYQCSVCGETAPLDFCGESHYRSNYCPNCGAKMDGGNANG